MGQSATLYRIHKSDFLKIIDIPGDLNFPNTTKGYKTFEKSFEGLRFVLSKNQDEETTSLVQQIFYPTTFIGEEIDYTNIDFENMPDDFDFENKAIYYNDPAKANVIASFLETITVEDFKKLFDPDELNEQDIYPGDVWNHETSEDFAFNELHMTEEFVKLKDLFQEAKNENDYILCFVE